jgi:hypothetical protein
MKIELNESQIDCLVKLTLSEERKKRTILPETWERAPAGKPKDPIGYWKALYDNLKKNGFPVKYQYPNDPAKSGYMYWGSWIISKDLKVNGGYPIYFYGSDKKYYHFKFKDKIYKGTLDLSKVELAARFTTYTYPMNLSMFKKSQKEITDELNKDIKARPGGSNAFDTLLGPFLEKNKPASVQYYKSGTNDKFVLSYKGKTPQENKQLWFKKNSEIWFSVSATNLEKKGTWSWDPKSGKPIVKNLKNQALDIGQVMSYPYNQLIAGDVEDEKLAQQIFTDLKKAFDYDNDGDWTDYDRTNETLAMNTINKIKNKGILDKLNAKIAAGGFPEIKNVEQWFKLEMSNWDPTEWDVIAKRLNSLGYSVPPAGTIAKIYGYAADKTINMVDKAITAAEDKFNYANKQTAVRKYTEPQALNILETQVSPAVDFLADMILNGTRWYGDSENLIARVFSRINNVQRYNQIKAIMKQDPLTFVKTFMSTKQIQKPVSANIPSIIASYNALFGDKVTVPGVDPNSKDFYSKLKNNLLFRTDNPRGTKDTFINTSQKSAIFNIMNNNAGVDPNIKGDTAIVPKDFGWNFNSGIYPYPKPYSMEWINAAKKAIGKLNVESRFVKLSPKQQIIEDIVKKYKFKLRLNQINEVGMDDGNTESDRQVDEYNQQKRQEEAAEKAKEEAAFKPIKTMIDWNNELARQRELIPKYCTTPLKVSEVIKANDPRMKTAMQIDWQTTKTHNISMYSLCKDYGGLWVQGAATNKYTCSCRDIKIPMFAGNVKLNRPEPADFKKRNPGLEYEGTYIDFKTVMDRTQTSKDWSDPTTWLETTKQALQLCTIVASMFFPVAAPLIGVIGGTLVAGMEVAQGNTGQAAVGLLFSVLPGLGPALNLEAKLIKSIGDTLINKGVLNAQQIEGFFKIINSEKLIAELLLGGKGSAVQIKNLANMKVTAGMSKQLKDQIIAARASVQGTEFIAQKGSEALNLGQVQKFKENVVTKVTDEVDKSNQEVRST